MSKKSQGWSVKESSSCCYFTIVRGGWGSGVGMGMEGVSGDAEVKDHSTENPYVPWVLSFKPVVAYIGMPE